MPQVQPVPMELQEHTVATLVETTPAQRHSAAHIRKYYVYSTFTLLNILSSNNRNDLETRSILKERRYSSLLDHRSRQIFALA